MGHLTQRTGLKKEDIRRFVITPLPSKDLKREASSIWQDQAQIYKTTPDELKEDITAPERTVLYVLAHSGRGVSHIADDDGATMSAEKLVDFLVDNGLPPKILAVKIWACFSGVNDFAKEVKAHFLNKKMGYDPVVVGYNEGTGGPSDVPNSPHKHVFQTTPDGKRGAVIGRASAHRTIF